MEIPESNMKPQQTGGLKLMTVFVVVLALHVVVIGGMTTYYLLKGGSADTDLAGDKNAKGLKANADGSLVADGTLTDTDKAPAPATTTTPAPDASPTSTASTPAPTTSSTPDQTPTSDVAPTPTAPVAQTPAPVAPSTPTALTPPPDVTTPVVTTKPAASTQSTAPAFTAPVITPATVPTPASPDMTQSAPVTGGTPYTVVSHDSLAKIAHKNHITVTNLMAANNMTSDKLSIGQKLVIPAKAPAASAELGTAEATAPGTTATTATAKADVATKKVAKDSAKNAAKSEVPIMTSEKEAKEIADAKLAKKAPAKNLEGHTYTIVKGDTLTKIAHKFKTTSAKLIAANNITDPTKLTIGKKLTIPSKESHTATVTTPALVQPAQVESKKAAAQLANNNQ